ncbi:LuxR C-terminal-related transcriptional regulator [Geodermatophilus sp. SYSU D00758]
MVALVALLEHGVALAAGHQEQARAALRWAEGALGDGGEVALMMRAARPATLGRPAAAGEVLAPVLAGSRPPVTGWAVVEAWVLAGRLALQEGRPARVRTALGRALALARETDVLRPLALAPGEVLDVLAGHVGGFGSLETTARRVLGARHALGREGRPAALTERELAVLRLLPSQRSFEEIADDLTVSHSTAKTHVRAIYGKLGVNTRRDAVHRARRQGILAVAPPGDGAR